MINFIAVTLEFNSAEAELFRLTMNQKDKKLPAYCSVKPRECHASVSKISADRDQSR
jgi:hypothetical protein